MKTKLLFMGTPDFAVATLRALQESGDYDITVVTQPDKPKGRKYTLTPPEVKVYAESVGLTVYQPTTLRDEAFASLLGEIDPQVIVVAAYGKILPKQVLEYPRYGCINVHGSLLPRYRGAAPIQRALMNGETETGVTIMVMNEGLDTGDMLTKVVLPITDDDNFETLFDRMAEAGAKALLATLPPLLRGELTPEGQDDALATYAEKITKGDCLLDTSRSAEVLYHVIRGLSPFPLAYVMRGNDPLKIVAAKRCDLTSTKEEGTLYAVNGELYLVCGGGTCLKITEVLPAGKKRMKAEDFLRGNVI